MAGMNLKSMSKAAKKAGKHMEKNARKAGKGAAKVAGKAAKHAGKNAEKVGKHAARTAGRASKVAQKSAKAVGKSAMRAGKAADKAGTRVAGAAGKAAETMAGLVGQKKLVKAVNGELVKVVKVKDVFWKQLEALEKQMDRMNDDADLASFDLQTSMSRLTQAQNAMSQVLKKFDASAQRIISNI